MNINNQPYSEQRIQECVQACEGIEDPQTAITAVKVFLDAIKEFEWPINEEQFKALQNLNAYRVRLLSGVADDVMGRSLCSSWVTPKESLPEEGEWVLHTYAGVRAPEYGMYARGRFWRNNGPESFPTTHWLRIPAIDDSNKDNQ